MSLTISRPFYLASIHSSQQNQQDRLKAVKKSPDLPFKVKFLATALSFAVDITRRPDGTVDRNLMNFLDAKSPPSPTKSKHGVKTTDITVDPTRNLWFRLYTPANIAADAELPVIFFFHGGGFAFMSADSKTYDDFCSRLTREFPAVVISVNFRLSPEHRCPCQYEDCLDVIEFVDKTQINALPPGSVNLKHSFLAGDSAGANIAHHVALKASECQFRKVDLAGIVSIQPCFGGEERTESEIRLDGAPFVNLDLLDWVWRSFLPEGADRDHPVANVFGPNSVDIRGIRFPATIVFVGGYDPLQDRQKRYYEGLKKRGKEAYLVEYPNAIHFFYAYPELPESGLFVNEVKKFMQNEIKRERAYIEDAPISS